MAKVTRRRVKFLQIPSGGGASPDALFVSPARRRIAQNGEQADEVRSEAAEDWLKPEAPAPVSTAFRWEVLLQKWFAKNLAESGLMQNLLRRISAWVQGLEGVMF